MDKQKQIEEMAKDLKEEKLYALINKTSYMRSAENLINAGYRKIPENAVVLTEEEYERWQGQTLNIKKVRKETAEKFAEMAKKWNEEAELGNWVEVELAVINDAIDQICKEITESK